MGQSPELAPVASVVCNGSLMATAQQPGWHLLTDSISVSSSLSAWDITYSISSHKGAMDSICGLHGQVPLT